MNTLIAATLSFIAPPTPQPPAAPRTNQAADTAPTAQATAGNSEEFLLREDDLARLRCMRYAAVGGAALGAAVGVGGLATVSGLAWAGVANAGPLASTVATAMESSVACAPCAFTIMGATVGTPFAAIAGAGCVKDVYRGGKDFETRLQNWDQAHRQTTLTPPAHQEMETTTPAPTQGREPADTQRDMVVVLGPEDISLGRAIATTAAPAEVEMTQNSQQNS